MLLLRQMTVLFLYMAIGYGACKKGVLDARTGQTLSWLVVNIVNPAMILSSVVNADGDIRGSELILTAVIAVAIFAALIALAEILPRLLRIPAPQRRYFKLMTMFNNIGFMGFPVIASLYGTSALLYSTVFLLPFNILFYTYGVATVGGKCKFPPKSILNVGVAASVLALVLYLVKLPTPEVVKIACAGLSSLAAPLSMMVIGISLAGMELGEIFRDGKLVLFSLVKLLAVPVLGMAVICRVVESEVLQGVCMIMLATPVASLTAMLDAQNGESTHVAAKGVALTTLLSVVTMPLLSVIVPYLR